MPNTVSEWLNGFCLISPLQHITKIAPRPILLVHGNKDETVGVSDIYCLYQQAKKPRQMVFVDGVEHNLRRNDSAVKIAIDWLKSNI